VDSALLRPGRFDRLVLVPAPDYKARVEILKVHTKRMPLTKDVGLDDLAKKTEGFSGADLEALAREAAMEALRKDKKAKEVRMKDFESVVSKMTPSITKDIVNYYERFIDRRKKVEREGADNPPRYIG
ncbi:MAG: AAA family ATPase, partial [Candidatus Aenigmarchaeota archaeon]|nr:AAA family ATPase [Candidatus Aenigmarchaeota archaeon]